jgi:hypothetical protein
MGAMSDRTRLGLGLLGAAFVLGVLGDELLRATPLGINLFLWVVALAITLVLRDRRTDGGDWRTWNWSRRQSDAALEQLP